MMKSVMISVGTAMLLVSLAADRTWSQVDLSIGAVTWYSWWQPAWHDGRQKNQLVGGSPSPYVESILDMDDYPWGRVPLVSPVVSLNFFKRVSIASYYMYGWTTLESQGAARFMQLYPQIRFPVNYIRMKRDITKWESDTTLGVVLNRYLRLIAGFKYHGYSFDQRQRLVPYGTPSLVYTEQRLVSTTRNYGPGLGLGLNLPLVGGLYLMVNGTGVVLWGRERASMKWVVLLPGGSPPIQYMPRGRFISYGGTVSTSLAYYIDAINTTLSLGFRYQVLRYRQLDGDVSFDKINGRYDHFLGITCSAVYTFNFGRSGAAERG